MPYIEIDGQWYQTDDQGNIIYSDTPSDSPGTLTRKIETGNMIDDPNQKRVFYTIQGYNKTPDEDMKMRRGAKKLRNKSIKDLMGGKDKLTRYEKRYNNGQHFTKEDFENEEFLNNLANIQFNDKWDAGKVRNITHPVLSKKIKNGHLEWDKDKYYVNIPTIDVNQFCGDTDISFGSRLTTMGGFKWIDPVYSSAIARPQKNIEYGQMPEMKMQYAVPIQTTIEEVREEEPVIKPQLIPKPNRTQNTTEINYQRPRPVNTGTNLQKPRPTGKVKSEKTTQKKTNGEGTYTADTTKVRTGTRIKFPDGTYGETTWSEWQEQ